MNLESHAFSDFFAISNQSLWESYDHPFSLPEYARQLGKLAFLHPKALILREKNLSNAQYEALFRMVYNELHASHTPLYLHAHYELLEDLPADGLHLPLETFLYLAENRADFLESCHKKDLPVGTSIHSITDAKRVETLGADYCFAGTIWESQCKPGKAAAGLSFLSEVCETVKIPVYAIGGVTPQKHDAILSAGAAGGCMMSGFLQKLYEKP